MEPVIVTKKQSRIDSLDEKEKRWNDYLEKIQKLNDEITLIEDEVQRKNLRMERF